ncbi:MAG: class I SAM-dependent methyltransferase [Pseudomonadota bacterium]
MREKNIDAFKSDIISNNGYLYTNTNKLSCRLSVNRSTQAIHQVLGSIKGKKVIDIGCGDGVYTKEFIAMQPESVVGVDPNHSAIELAKKDTIEIGNIHFQVMDIYNLPLEQKYDVAIIRGVLHHLYDVEKAIERVCKIAKRIIVLEPNGYNLILKIIEKTSSYHVQHEEKSYFSHKLNKWFLSNGGRTVKSYYIGLVPIFFPDFIARVLKFIEPFFEKIPILRNFCCGQYVQVIQMNNTSFK